MRPRERREKETHHTNCSNDGSLVRMKKYNKKKRKDWRKVRVYQKKITVAYIKDPSHFAFNFLFIVIVRLVPLKRMIGEGELDWMNS